MGRFSTPGQSICEVSESDGLPVSESHWRLHFGDNGRSKKQKKKFSNRIVRS